MKNCKNCGSNDRVDSGEFRKCNHCGTSVKIKRKAEVAKGGGFGGINWREPLLERFDVGYQSGFPNRYVKFQE